MRPLASGALGVPQAIGFLGVQCGVGLGVLLALPPYAVGLSMASVPLVCLYPLAKRVTSWPQVVLGLTFNWGALVGWSAVHGACEWSAVLPLYVGGFWWTLMYDTIYAHQDKVDDAKLGIGSTALTLGDGEAARKTLAGFAMATIASLGMAGAAVGVHPAYLAALAGGGTHLAWQVGTVDFGSRGDCLRKFQSNHVFGALIFAGLVAGQLLASDDASDNGDGSEQPCARSDASPRPGSMLQLLRGRNAE